MRIALITCTSRKKAYKCPARELYSESPRFRLAYTFAKLVANKIFILSSKYGLVPEDAILEPYDETLHDKSPREKLVWAERVVKELRRVSDLERDEFIIIAGRDYYENLLPHLSHFWLPLKGKSLREWAPELERLINIEKETDKVMVLHMLFNSLPRLDWTKIDQISYHNGIYVMFEKGESYYGLDRIVRIGTHYSQNRLQARLKYHFIVEDADGSIFRKNIGRVFLNNTNKAYLRVWDIDMRKPENEAKYGHLVDKKLEADVERKISEYLRNNITFVCFPVNEKAERRRLEEGMIALLNKHPWFGPSSRWLGLGSPVPEIARSGLWNIQGLDGKPLSDEELERIKWLTRFGNESYNNNVVTRPQVQIGGNSVVPVDKPIPSPGKTSADIKEYIDRLIREAKLQGKDYIDLVSGEIHKQMGLKNRMPVVCNAMYSKMMPGDEVLHTTPSGFSSTIRIRYYLRNR